MKVLLVTGSLPPAKCGVGDYTFKLAQALAGLQNVRVGILTSVGVADHSSGIEVLPVIRRWRLTEVPTVWRVLRQWAPDIVHIQYPTQGYARGLLPWMLPLLVFIMGKKVVQTWHEPYRVRHLPKLLFKAPIPGALVVVRPRYCETLPLVLRWAISNKRCVFISSGSAIPKSTIDHVARDRMRDQYLKGQRRLIVFFGFIYPHKGVDLLFEIANPATDHIVVAGEMTKDERYHRLIRDRASSEAWSGHVTITGFISSNDAADLIAIADAMILPFRSGGGEWNTTIRSGILQGTLIITTSLNRLGYDDAENVFYAKPNDIGAMKTALQTYAGKRRALTSDSLETTWQDIAQAHEDLYSDVIGFLPC